jgi:subtilase family serine protease
LFVVVGVTTFQEYHSGSARGRLGVVEWLLAALAAAGTTTVAAAGDDGSAGYAPRDTNPAVEYPASSAFVTAVDGVTYSGPRARPRSSQPGTSRTSQAEAAARATPSPRRHGNTATGAPGPTSQLTSGTNAGTFQSAPAPPSAYGKPEATPALAATALGATGLLLAADSTRPSQRFGNVAAYVWRTAT